LRGHLLIDIAPTTLGKERIVGYRAKWDPAAFEYAHTPRTFEFPPTDAPLIDRLREIALRCWKIFGLTGYARVDFRIGPDLRPYVLEINDNPCISPDAGFAASVERAGITPMQMAPFLFPARIYE